MYEVILYLIIKLHAKHNHYSFPPQFHYPHLDQIQHKTTQNNTILISKPNNNNLKVSTYPVPGLTMPVPFIDHLKAIQNLFKKDLNFQNDLHAFIYSLQMLVLFHSKHLVDTIRK